MARLLGLSRRAEASELQKLAIGECITRLSGERISRPFRLKIPYQGDVGATPEDLEIIAQKSVSEMEKHVVAVEKVEQEQPPSEPSVPPKRKGRPRKENGLKGDALVRFLRFATEPPELLEVAETALGWDRGREYRARRVLENLGLISHTTEGNKRRIAFLSEQGKDLAKKQGWRIRRHKGDPGHDWMVIETEKRFSRLPQEVEGVKSVRFRHRGFGDLMNGRQPDSLALISMRNEKGKEGEKEETEDKEERKGGSKTREERVAIQVCSRNNTEYETLALGEIISWRDLLAVVLVASNRDKKEAIRRKLMEVSGGDIPEKIVLFHLEEILSPKINLGQELRLE